MKKAFARNFVQRNGMMRILIILLLGLSFVGCAHCKSGQVKLGDKCYWPGNTYTTSLSGGVIRD